MANEDDPRSTKGPTNAKKTRKTDIGRAIVIPDDFPGFPINSIPIPAHYSEDLERILLPHGLILNRIEQLAKDVAMQYDSEGFTAVCILKDGHKFFVDFVERMKQFNLEAGTASVPLSIDFVRAKKDVNSNEPPQVISFKSLDNIRGKNVLLVKGICRTGQSIMAVMEFLKKFEPRDMKVATLLMRRSPQNAGYRPDFVGFDTPNCCLVGYTFEFNEHFSDLCHICVMNDVGRKKYSIQK